MKLGRDYFLSIRDFQTFDHIGNYTGQVLIVYGDQDDVVPFHAMEQAKRLYQHAELIVLEGEGHGFSLNGSIKAFGHVLDFLKANTPGKMDDFAS